MRLCFLLCSPVLAACGCAAGVFAQAVASGGQGPVPVFKANAHAVVVDVVVTKGNDEPVLALHKQNFTVIEDGKPQTVDLFEEHTARTLPPGALPGIAKMPPNVYTNVPPVPESDSVNVLLLDSLNTPKQDQMYVHRQIMDFLQKMKPGTRVAIFTLGSKLRFVQGFTTDISVLQAALNDRKNGVSPEKDAASQSREDKADDAADIGKLRMMLGGRSDGGVEALTQAMASFAQFELGNRIAMTLEALDYLARYLGGVPGRKNLIWFSSSFPVTVFPNFSQRQEMSNLRTYLSAVRKTADLLTVSKVAVYPVGAQGVMEDHVTMADNSGLGMSENSGRVTMGGMGNYSAEAGERADQIAAMEQLAADTGGKAFYNTNDLNTAISRAIDDGAHYYTLIYAPTNKKMDGKYRHIEVKVTDGKYKLAYRRGYNADDTSTPEPAREADPLKPLLRRGLPNATQLLYGVRVAPAKPQPGPNATRAGKNPKPIGPVTRYDVDFMIRWTDVALKPEVKEVVHGEPQVGPIYGKIQVGLMAYDRDGNAVNWIGATQEMHLQPEVYAAIQKSGVPAHMEIDLPNADVYLETGVYDWGTGKAGTLEVPVNSARIDDAQNQQALPRGK